MQRDCALVNHIRITEVFSLTELLLLMAGILVVVTVGAATEYYRRLRMAQKEYEQAKEIVGDIVMSFRRQLNRQDQKLELVAYKVEAGLSKSDNALRKAEEAENRLLVLEPKVGVRLKGEENLLIRLNEIDKEIRDVVASHEALTGKVSQLETRARPIPRTMNIEAVIPIKREKALAPLTQTELSVLELLAIEGAKTAPQIKDRIRLSREHTARLMKKLYQEGYLERDTSKIPFRYHIKKEMEELLKRAESETT